MRSSKDTIKAIFLGYQGSGKTTFLTTAKLASLHNKIDVDIGGGMEFFDENSKSLINKGQVIKTAIEQWFKLTFNIEFSGEQPFVCETIDYPGELAEQSSNHNNQNSLIQFISESHCMYLFFDSTLSNLVLKRKKIKITQEWGRRQIGQAEAISQARTLFADKHPERPVVVVVMKADVLFEDRSTREKKQIIKKLNSDDDLAKKIFLRAFGRRAKVLLETKIQSPCRICYVAALGVKPKVGDDSDVYLFPDLTQWIPIGIKETLFAGMFEGIKRKRIETIAEKRKDLFKKTLPFATIGFVFLLFLAVVLLIDYRKLRYLDQLVTDHKNGKISANEVYMVAKESCSFWHPYLYISGKKTPVFTIPDLSIAKKARTILLNYTIYSLKEKLDFYKADAENLHEKLSLITSFTDKVSNLQGRHNNWELFIDTVEYATEDVENSKELKTILELSIKSYGLFLSQVVRILWNSAMNDLGTEADLKLIENQVKPFLDKIDKLSSNIKYGNAITKELIHDVKRRNNEGLCNFLINCNQKIENEQDNFEKQFYLLTKICFKCETLKNDACSKLVQHADYWDYQEANELFKMFPHGDIGSNATIVLLNYFKTYYKHVNQRREIKYDHQGRYEIATKQFLDWNQSLENNYIGTINLQIKKEAPFVRSEGRTREVKDGWSTRTEHWTQYFVPHGSLTLHVGDIDIANISYSGYNNSITLDKKIQWKPGYKVSVSLINNDSGKTILISNTSDYSLIQVAHNGLINRQVTLKFIDLSVPKMIPEKLEPVYYNKDNMRIK